MGSQKSYRNGTMYKKVKEYVNKIRQRFDNGSRKPKAILPANNGGDTFVDDWGKIETNRLNKVVNRTMSKNRISGSVRAKKKKQESLRPTFVDESFRLHADPLSERNDERLIEITSYKTCTTGNRFDISEYFKESAVLSNDTNSFENNNLNSNDSNNSKKNNNNIYGDHSIEKLDSSLAFFNYNHQNYSNKDMSTHQMIAEYDTSENKLNVKMKKLTYQELLSNELVIEEMKDSIIWKPITTVTDDSHNTENNGLYKNNSEMRDLSAYVDATIEQLQHTASSDSMQWWLEEYKYSHIFE
ncbi:hypothetical protein TPHA_0A04300 [Tetrapisispora phaffii CBS 4417]|uniref:Uncharacterized protein n=1 Tax=Tetrapisispora phaffii (strain ATCC 24235 / CBS 4417 / NBRC 1672 / NRRL Y-8282 / UCD 70-5) TaxID=1071381 RepID=G8BNM6_TETPH|nr:hypothetical protein TPHA_0A04300 [Tetrapisispora phaffii CBS 4417]CCE61504.1 hypothetical protein TPHA_0A04300 [Tetrapisispora phaffii CBS 4417]